MNKREFCREVERNGFRLKRQTKHLIYSDGVSRLIVPGGSGSFDPRLAKKLKLDLKKAIGVRSGKCA